MPDPSGSVPTTGGPLPESQRPLETVPRPADAPSAACHQPESLFTPSEYPGELGTLGRFRVLKELGRGGMGVVYLGYDGHLERNVALKLMLPNAAANHDARERFVREARSAAKVKSDHVVTIHDVGEVREVPFIAMEYLLGHPLDQYLKGKGELALSQALRVTRETALGLAAAHALGVVHRDVKLANVWLEAPKGRVKLLDFGLARGAGDAGLTNSGSVIGTPAYMSPEQALGRKVDHRTDLFSLGVMLYRLAAGRMPFAGATTMEVLTSRAVDTPKLAREHNAQVPEVMDAIIMRLLAKNPADRFQTAAEVADALLAVEHALSAGPAPTVVAVPLVIGAQTQSVWEEITDSVPVPLVADSSTEEESDPAAEPQRKQPTHKLPKWTALLAVAALAAATAILVAARPGRKPFVDPGAKGPQSPAIPPSAAPANPIASAPAGERKTESMRYALRFNGRTSHVRTQFRFDGTYPITVEVVVTPEIPGTIAGDIQSAGLAVGSRKENWVFLFHDGQGYKTARSAQPPVIGRRCHVAGVYDKDLRQVRLYVDGQLAGSTETDGQFKPAAHPLMLGADPSPQGLPHQFFAGTIHGFRISKSVKYSTDFAPPLDLVKEQATALLYKFDEGKGDVLHDSSDNDRSGLIVGAEWIDRKKAGGEASSLLPTSDPERKAAEYVFSCGGGVKINGADREITTAADLPTDRFTLTAVNLYDKRGARDAGMANFKDCTDLAYLNLWSTPVGDAGLAHLKNCKKLTYLNLAWTPLTDDGLAVFKDIAGLDTLYLDGTRAGDKGVANFGNCKRLLNLGLFKTQVTSAGLAHFEGCKDLIYLHLWDSPVSDEGLAHFKDCRNLYFVNLSGTKATDEGVMHFKKCKNLQLLEVKGTKVTPATLAEFAKAQPGCKITHDGGVIHPKK